MVSVKTKSRKNDLMGNCLTELAACFIIFVLNFIFKLFIQIKIFEKPFFGKKNLVTIRLTKGDY